MTVSTRAIEAATATTVRIDGRELVLFAGCDYLGLAHHPRVVAALERGLREFGVSSSGSRATTGNTSAHDDLERDLARFFGVESALLVPDGYLSNIVLAQALPDEIRTILVDEDSHVSVRDALVISKRDVHEYAFADAKSAREAARTHAPGVFAIFTDGVFPVLRALAPLRELLDVLPAGGMLVVDDCHGIGVLGERGRGSVEHARIVDSRVVVTGTLSKSLGCFGGFIAGSREHIERARSASRAFVGSTPIPPALARAASTALAVIDDEPLRRARLFEHASRLRVLFTRLAVPLSAVPLPVFALQLKPRVRMEHVHDELLARGILVPCVDYPDGLGGYLRIAVRADHTDAQVDALIEGLTEALR
ncbi:MAG: pyridoxal phosphate-dependent aminotransferase family protein [Planctomycetota bacterium]|nr:pyridoxal phosphate-dependent aminotransferase family protein [Planctomycetota bacterium]